MQDKRNAARTRIGARLFQNRFETTMRYVYEEIASRIHL